MGTRAPIALLVLYGLLTAGCQAVTHVTPLQPSLVRTPDTAEWHAADLADQTQYRRAVEAAIWGMPLVSFDAMRQAFLRDVGAKVGDIAYYSKPADWRCQVTTPNASSHYVMLFYDVKDGPWVLEFPAAEGAGLFGSLNDAWQAPIVDAGPAGEDEGKGGKYLILPPGFKGEVPSGYLPARSATNNGYAFFRAIPATRLKADTDKAVALIKKLRLYPLAQAKSPPPQKHIDIAGKLFDGIARYDDTFYESLARMVTEEPVPARDLAATGQLRSIGIEKGKPFHPDARTRLMLRKAVDEAHVGFMESTARVESRWWPTARWGVRNAIGADTGFTFQTDTYLDVDERATTFFMACAPPKKLGKATMYLCASQDAAGAPLRGDRTYRLRVPPNVPAKQFWAVTVYDLETAAFLRDVPSVEANSYQDLKRNADGSVDVWFGPKAPAGMQSNWVATSPDRPWFTFFRFYGPDQPLFDRTWALPDLVDAATLPPPPPAPRVPQSPQPKDAPKNGK